MQFLQWLLKRKSASISDDDDAFYLYFASDKDNLNSATTEPYFPNSVTIDGSSDDEHVTNLMQDVNNC